MWDNTIQILLCRAIRCNTIHRWLGRARPTMLWIYGTPVVYSVNSTLSTQLCLLKPFWFNPSLSQTKPSYQAIPSQTKKSQMARTWFDKNSLNQSKSISASRAQTNNTMYQVKLWSQSWNKQCQAMQTQDSTLEKRQMVSQELNKSIHTLLSDTCGNQTQAFCRRQNGKFVIFAEIGHCMHT